MFFKNINFFDIDKSIFLIKNRFSWFFGWIIFVNSRLMKIKYLYLLVKFYVLLFSFFYIFMFNYTVNSF